MCMFKMSIDNIKELFCKRVQESTTFNTQTEYGTLNKGATEAEDEHLFHGLKEIDAGITEYLSNCKGFNGVIKQRFSDFHVHEIDCDGNIVYLTNRDIPVVNSKAVNTEIISNEVWEQLDKLQNKAVESVEIDVTDYPKEKRKEIHEAIKSKYGSLFKSNTTDIDEKKFVVISLGKDTFRNQPWFSELGKYLHFVLFKRNLDTVEAINIIATQLHTKASNLTYAGTKDKRAVTCQRVSMCYLDAKRLNGINEKLRDMSVGNFVYKNTPLKLGDLNGNLFEIVLRNVTENDEVINSTLNTVKENGFINYFGLQRFGNSIEIPTYEIGKALIKGDFKSAVELILKPRRGKMAPDLREARKIWWETRNASKAFNCLRTKNRTIEGKLLLGLSKHGQNAYVNALDSIPRNVRLLYLHAYQSFVWNKVLSRRMKEFGKAVLEGDLIFVNDKKRELETSDTCEEEKEEEESESSLESSVRCLSKDEAQNHDISDVVHPLPGHAVTYPNNVVKEWYEELLKEDGLKSEDLKQTVATYSLSGTYRYIVKKMKDMSWNVCYYSKPEDELVLSDLDRLQGVTKDINETNDKYKAVILKFVLDSSTYATMALREILKIDTSSSHQATLNSYSNKRAVEDEDETIRKKSKV